MRATPRLSVLLSALLLIPGLAAAQRPLKVYISVDMEGISGINSETQLSAGGSEYGRGRRLMVEDANAAIRGAFAGGATEVLVNDSHGSQRNLLPEELDPRARLISHSFKRYGMMEGLDSSFHAVLFVGYHGMAGSARGFMAHTGSGVLRDLQVNGRSVGEGGMNALLAEWYGVPVALVTGDDVAVEQQREITPGVRGVAVKRAINARAVELKPLTQARGEIEQAAREAVAAARRSPGPRPAGHRVRMEFRDPTFVDVATAFGEITAVSAHAVEFSRGSMPEAYRLIRVLYRFLTTD